MLKLKYSFIFIFSLTILFFVACQDTKKVPVKTEEVTLTPLQEIEKIIQLWAGHYNNDEQIAERRKAGEEILEVDADNMGWLWLTAHYIPLEKREIGDHLLYVEEYRDGKPEATYRQRIYKLVTDSTGTNRVVMCTFKDKKKYVGAYQDLSMLDSLTADDISPYPNVCDLIITKNEDGYTMKMEDKACAFGGKYFDYRVQIDGNRFLCRDRIVKVENDSVITSAANYQWHELDLIN